MGLKGTEKDRIVGKNVIEGRRTDGNRRRRTENVREQILRNKNAENGKHKVLEGRKQSEDGKINGDGKTEEVEIVKETYGRMSGARKTDGTGGSELRDTLEGTGHGKRQKSGTYNAG